MRKLFRVFAFVLILLNGGNVSTSPGTQTIEQILYNSTELSQFYGMVTTAPMAATTLRTGKVTIFAPTNLAFQTGEIKTEDNDNLVLYHMSNTPVTLNELDNSLASMAEGNPTLWINKVQRTYLSRDSYAPKNVTKMDIYVNNAKIDLTKSNNVHHLSEYKTQVLHVIEEVLQPLVRKRDMSPANPTALQFLERFEDFLVGPYHVKNFWERIREHNRTALFSAEGRNTFFIPVDDSLQITDPKSRIIDGKVIDGHVIPGHVIFTAPANEEYMYQTSAFTDLIKVTVSFVPEKTDRTVKKFVRSNTVVGDSSHPNGAVISRIVQANIPLKNGVAHLIKRPLMVIDNTVLQFLESFEKEADGPLHEFLKVLRGHEEDLIRILGNSARMYTIFAPSNEAWNDTSVQTAIRNDTLIRQILRMHVVDGRHTLSSIQQKLNTEVMTIGPSKKRLYFNVTPRGGINYTLTVEGGGVNATVTHPDIAATNGIIHIIDRVLGVPCSTIKDKLATDPQLNGTYTLSKHQNFVDRFAGTGNYTFFVPRDAAWKDLRIDYPNLYNILFDPRNGYQATQILERHLIADKTLTMADLQQMSYTGPAILPASRDYLSLRVRGDPEKGYALEWRNNWINVYKADIRCTNGIIHVIDKVLLQDSDIKLNVSGAASVVYNFGVLLSLGIFSLLIARFYQ